MQPFVPGSYLRELKEIFTQKIRILTAIAVINVAKSQLGARFGRNCLRVAYVECLHLGGMYVSFSMYAAVSFGDTTEPRLIPSLRLVCPLTVLPISALAWPAGSSPHTISRPAAASAESARRPVVRAGPNLSTASTASCGRPQRCRPLLDGRLASRWSHRPVHGD